MQQMSTKLPVIIVGAGPSGLTAALSLARQGIPVHIYERRPGTSIHPRARGLNVRTMEIYRGLGLQADLEAAGSDLAESKYMLFVESLAGTEIRRVPDDDLVLTGDALDAYTPCSWTQCAQDRLEPLLLDAARTAGARVHFGREVIGVSQDDVAVHIEVREIATGILSTHHASYLLAADGARSPIRTMLGIPVVERAVQGHYVNCYFRADLSELVQGREFALCFVENAAAPGIFLAVNNRDRWLFNAEYDPARTSLETFTEDYCRRLVQTAIGIPNIPVEIISILPWDATARYAERMQQGRVLLLGDAAHTMPPAGGLGLNTGVADAHNLAWKLAWVLTQRAQPALLDTYQDERLPVAKLVVEQAARDLEAGRPDAPPEGGLATALIPILGMTYESAAIVPDGTPSVSALDLTGRPGTRLPHLWLDHAGERISTLDLVGDHFTLLIGPDGAHWQAEASTVPNLSVIQIGGEGAYRDSAGVWCERNGIGQGGALLVRPDGFVAWRCIDDRDADQFGAIMSHLLLM